MSDVSLERHAMREDGDETIGWLATIDDKRSIWCGEISRDLFERMAPDDQNALGGNDFGWFIVYYHHHDTKVIGRCSNEYTAGEIAMAIAKGIAAGACVEPT